MRDIKFRAWDKENKHMTYNIQEMYDGYCDDTDNGLYGYMSCFTSFLYDENFIVMQYTGLKDMNGKEIYEGDLCKVSDEEPYINDYFITDYNWKMIMYVDFEYGAFQFREVKDKHMSIYYIETQDMDIEVIGNIFENPELIKVGR